MEFFNVFFVNLQNSMFVGPVLCVPFIILSIYGLGYYHEGIPLIIEIGMKFSYLRYSLEGVVAALLMNRGNMRCPEEEVFCPLANVDLFLRMMRLEKSIFWVAILALFGFYIVFRGICFYLLKQRLSPGKTFRAIQVIGRIVKTQFNLNRWMLPFIGASLNSFIRCDITCYVFEIYIMLRHITHMHLYTVLYYTTLGELGWCFVPKSTAIFPQLYAKEYIIFMWI